MRWKPYFLPILVGAATGTPQSQIRPGEFIVEYEETGLGLLSSVLDVIGDVTKILDFDYDLFKGAAILVNNDKSPEEQISSLLSNSRIKNVWPRKLVSAPSPHVEGVGPLGSADSSHLGVRHLQGNQTYSPHVMTQVDKLHAKGITGEGVKIAIVDTGIDYTHPALGGCFGPDCLIIEGYDFVGDDYDGDNTPIPDNDPMDTCTGHGTHVAGIIAARENEYGFKGAAPGVKIAAYRVFGCHPKSGNDMLAAGFLRAQQDGAHIISASIGSSDGWSEDFVAVIASRIVAKGVSFVNSAGNSGDDGLFRANSPAAGKGVAAIASYDNTLTPVLLSQSYYSVADDKKKQTFQWARGNPNNWTDASGLPLWIPSFKTNQTLGACAPISNNTVDLSGKIVLLFSDECVDSYFQSAMALGAGYFLVASTGSPLNMDIYPFPVLRGFGVVSSTVGATWLADLVAGKTVTLDFTDLDTLPVTLEQYPNNSSGGYLSYYTSWGPSYEGESLPTFGTPGGKILSTYPVALGSYAVLSGTSMACPLASAIYALVSNARNTFDPIELQNVLAATAKPVQYNQNGNVSSLIAPVPQQGAGILQAYDAAYLKTVLSRSSLSFNDTVRLNSQSFTISNTGDEDVTYELDVIGAGTAYTFSGSIRPAQYPDGPEIDSSYATVDLSNYNVTVPAGGKVTITAKATPPSLDISRLPVYSGYVRLNGTNGERLSLPYQGIVGDMSTVTVMNGTYVATSSGTPDFPPIDPSNSTFLFPQADAKNITDDLPTAAVDLVFGSPLINIEIMTVSNYSVNLGSVVGGPYNYTGRGVSGFKWNGQLANQSFVPPGSYKFRVSALHIFGDRDQPRDYDVAESPSFRIAYK